MILSTSACSTTQQRIDQAGASIGAAAARVELEPWPAYCRAHTAYPQAKVGDEMSTLVKRSISKIDEANAKTDACTIFYEDYRRRLASGK